MEPIVTITDGQIRGLTDTTQNGKKIFKFLGIPFAKPPIKDLRFKAPVPPEPWTGIKDCTKDSSQPCAMDIWFTQKILGSEDCLYLNVYTRELGSPSSQLRPVMVFIFGGGFISGTASEALVGPKLLLDEDVVLVVPAYRVGAFGFSCADDESLDIPGNAGLKDQNLALKWVQKNISKFSGDPNNVTLFGVSAGSASVEFHVISPASKGLFHKAIMQTGSVLNSWAWGSHQNVIQLAQTINKNVKTEKEAVDTLQALSDRELALASFQLPDALVDSGDRRWFAPVIERPNPTAFITENPVDLLTSGRYNHVPIIKGMTSNEGIVNDLFRKIVGLTKKPVPNHAIAWTYGLKPGSEQYTKLFNSIKQFYFKNDDLNTDEKHVFEGDVLFLGGVVASTTIIANTSKQPLYFYVYSGETEYAKSIFKLLLREDDPNYVIKGVPHAIEQFYLFNLSAIQKIPDEALKLSKITTKIWANFARTSDPNTETIKWQPVDQNQANYLDITLKPVMKVNPFGDRWLFWQNVLRQTPINKNTF